jgi:type I restriction enzyme M protein
MSSGFLFSNNKKDKKLKKELIDNGHVDKIIALPERIFYYTSIAVNLIVLSKKPKAKSTIEFIDASEKYKKGDKVNILDDVEIYRLLAEEENKLKRFVSIEEVSKNGYNLSVNRYVFEDLNLSTFENHNLVPLKDLIDQIPGKVVKPNENIRVVKSGDLANNTLETIKSFTDAELKMPKYNVRLIEDNSLLLATVWKSLKPTIYKKDKENIYYDPSLIFACKVDDSKVDIDYLVLELNKDYIQKQLEQRSVGTSISRINRDDLLKIEVVVPDLGTQKKRKFEFKESVLLEHQKKFENLKKQLGVDVADENSFLRHKISGTLKNIRGSYNKLKDIIDNQIHKDLPGVYEYKVNPKLNTTLKDYLYRLDRDIQSVHTAVRKVGGELKLDDVKFETLNFIKFIKDYVEEVNNRSNNFEISIDIDKEALRDSSIKEINFRGDKELLHQVFDNIIENAERHAFTKDKQHNKIKVDLLYDFEDLEVQLDFTNTGKPLPEDYSFKAFTRKGSTSGSNAGNGIGGWFIYEAMKLHDGKFGFTDETGPEGILDEDYATTIELTFPIEIKI